MLRIWPKFFKMSILREMEFRENLLLHILGNLIKFGFTFLFFGLIYAHVDRIGTWSREQIFLLISFNQISVILYDTFFKKNISKFSSIVRKGDLDTHLIKPLDTIFYMTTRQIDIIVLFSLPVAIALFVYSMHQLHLAPGVRFMGIFCISLICSIALRIVWGILVMTFAFWATRVEAFHALEETIFGYATYPRQIYTKFYRYLFTYIIPVILVASYPVELMMGTLTTGALAILVLWSFFGLMGVRYFFKRAIHRYSSAGG